MITLIHGDDITKSREFYLRERKKEKNTVLFEGESVTLTDITETLAGSDLFGSVQTACIENFLTKRRKSKEKDAILAYMLSQKDATILLWEEKELDKRTLSAFKSHRIHVFSLPKSLFVFLDSIRPCEGKRLVSLLHETLSSTEPEMIVFMLARQIRILLALLSPSEKTIDEVNRLAPWQRGKLQKQAQFFTQDELISLHTALFTLDRNQKTGNLPSDLVSTIDFLLMEL